MRFLRRFIHDSSAQAAVQTAIALPICIYAFFMLMEICLSLYSASVVRNTAESTLSYVQERGATARLAVPGSGIDSSNASSTAGSFATSYFAQNALNVVAGDPPSTCVSWWQPGTTVGPYGYEDCSGNSGEGSYSWGNGNPSNPQIGQEVAVQVTWRYNPWLSHLFPTPSTFTYTAVGPVLY